MIRIKPQLSYGTGSLELTLFSGKKTLLSIRTLVALYRYAKGRGKQEDVSCILYHTSVQRQQPSLSSLITIVFKDLLIQLQKQKHGLILWLQSEPVQVEVTDEYLWARSVTHFLMHSG